VRAIRTLGVVTGVRFEVTGEPTGAGPFVFVANHSSLLDIAAMALARPNARFLAAAELFRIPLLASAMRALGTIPVDRADPRRTRANIDALVRDLAGTDVVVFAEGGIRTDGLSAFKSGAFRIAIATGTPVVPVTIRGTATALPAGGRLRLRPADITIHLGAPIPTQALDADDLDWLRDRTHAAIEAQLAAQPPGWYVPKHHTLPSGSLATKSREP
jgi:1-acyl-sn-glycerol-3-phosphate acyltransferase